MPPAPPFTPPPSRRDRRRALRAAARQSKPSQETRAFFCTALDGKVHVVRHGQRATICGRNGLTIGATVDTGKNRCSACAKALA